MKLLIYIHSLLYILKDFLSYIPFITSNIVYTSSSKYKYNFILILLYVHVCHALKYIIYILVFIKSVI